MKSVVETGHLSISRPRLAVDVPWTILIAIVVAFLALLPFCFVVWAGIETGWEAASHLIFRARVGDLMVNTVLLILFTVPICIILSVTLAWLTERTDLPAARLWSWLAIAPLAVPAFVHSYAWVGLWPSFNGLPAGIAISVIAY